MEGKTLIRLICVILMTIGVVRAQFKGGYCPLRNTVSKCMPTCVNDFQCSFNEKCCPNMCNSRSCTSASPVSTGGSGGYKGSYDQDTYCGGRKCSRYEKCQFNRATKREECVRT